MNFNNIIFDNNYHNYIASKNRQIGKLIYRNYLSLNNDPKINESKIINYIRKFDLNHLKALKSMKYVEKITV